MHKLHIAQQYMRFLFK